MTEHYGSSSDAGAAAGLIVIFVLALFFTLGFVACWAVKAVVG